MQENRSFDHYFGTYRGADGIPGLAGHPGRVPCIPDPERAQVRAAISTTGEDLNYGGPHNEQASVADINGGKMDGFIAEHEKGLRGCKCRMPPGSVVGYHNGSDIPNYWTYAHNFVLQDHMFESARSWSLPSHLYLVSLWSAHCTRHNDPCQLSQRARESRQPPGGTSPAPLRMDRPHLPAPQAPRQLALLHLQRDRTRLRVRHHASVRPGDPGSQRLLDLESAAVRSTPSATTTRSRDIQSLNGFFAAADRDGCRPSRGSCRAAGLRAPDTASVSRGQTYVTGLINTIMESSRLEVDRDLS